MFQFHLWLVSLPDPYKSDVSLLAEVSYQKWKELVEQSDYLPDTTRVLRLRWVAEVLSIMHVTDLPETSFRDWIFSQKEEMITQIDKSDVSIYKKRAFYDAFYFVLQTTSTVAEPPDDRRISLKKGEYDELVRLDVFKKLKEEEGVLPKSEILKKVEQAYSYGSVQSCLMKLYLEIPLRDDAQLSMILMNTDNMEETLDVLHKQFDERGLRVNVLLHHPATYRMWIYLSITKTIPRVYPPLLQQLSKSLTGEFLAYISANNLSGEWRWASGVFKAGRIFDEKGVAGTGKLSLTIRQIMRKKLGIKNGSINYLRRVHQTEAEEKGTSIDVALINQQAGHSSAIGAQYLATLLQDDSLEL